MEPFPKYFDREVSPLKVIDKRKSWFMKAVNIFLTITNSLKITSIKNFMSDYITTIGHRVYGGPGWAMTMNVNTTLLHELVHLIGFKNDGFLKYSWRYLTSKRWRAKYESICVQVELLWLGDAYQDMVEINRRCVDFIPYGIPAPIMYNELHDRLEEIRAGKPHRDAQIVIEAHNKWKEDA